MPYASSVKVLASVDVLGCEAVKLVKGVPGTGLRLGDPLALAERLQGLGATWLHIVDLDGALRGSPSPCVLGLVKRATGELGLRIQLGGGLRSIEALEEAYAAGAERLVVGSAWLRDPGFLDEAADALGRGVVVAAVEERHDGLAASSGWRSAAPLPAAEAAALAASKPVWGILYTQVHVEGTMAGAELLRAHRVAEAARGVGLQFSGGVRGQRDLDLLAALGYGLAVVGMAIHTWALAPPGLLA